MEQAPLALDFSKGRTQGFVQGSSNMLAIQTLRAKNWPDRRLILTGESQSGKTTLAQALFADAIWIDEPEAAYALIETPKPQRVILDQVDQKLSRDHAWAEIVFHLCNLCQNTPPQAAPNLLLIAAHDPKDWEITLMDLHSRIEATTLVSILPPDEAMIMNLLARSFHERGVRLEPAVLSYLQKRIPRNYPEIFKIIDAIDRMAHETNSRITIPFLGEFFCAKMK